MYLRRIFITLSALAILGVGSYIGYSITTKDNDKQASIQIDQSAVPQNKEWVITFDHGINEKLMNEKFIYVQDEEGNKVPVSLKMDNLQNLIVKPPKDGYQKGKTYYLHLNRDLDLENINNNKLPEQYHIKFSVT